MESNGDEKEPLAKKIKTYSKNLYVGAAMAGMILLGSGAGYYAGDRFGNVDLGIVIGTLIGMVCGLIYLALEILRLR